MIIDFNDDSAPLSLEADICIIGSGAASLAFLTKLYNSSYKVVVLEAGGEQITDQNQDLYKVITPLSSFEGANNGRFRVFGGSTTRWGGQSLPLDRIDFARRDWLPNTGWPINYDSLHKYYAYADRFLNLDPTAYEKDIFALLKEKRLKTINELQFRFSKWSPLPNLREQYRKEIAKSAHVTLLKNANVTNLMLSSDHSGVEWVVFKNFSKKTGIVKAKRFVLACGGIENARILLASDTQLPSGVGNDNGLVGRFLQDHPRAEVGSLVSSKKQQSYLNYFYLGKTRIMPRFFFSDDFQRKHSMLNSTGFVEFYTQEDDVFTIAKEIYRKQIRGQLSLKEFQLALKLVKNLPELLLIAKYYYINKKVYTPNARARLNVMTESQALWENNVSLSSEVDALGMKRAVINWTIDEKVRHTFLTATELISKYFTTSGLGKIQVDDWLYSDDWKANIRDSKHHIGTTRMAFSPKEGVVDENCKVFGTRNLYIAGSSVFPTSGQSNPTTTLIALAFRLGDHFLETK